ncbi:MAG: STAS domain-containing protein [Acidimicrobiales bacterium]
MTVEMADSQQLRTDDTVGPRFEVSLRHVGAVCILTLRGELRAGSVAVLEAEFDRLGRTRCRRVVVDVTELSRLDEVGSRVLTGLSHYVRARGGVLTVVGARPPIARALDLS